MILNSLCALALGFALDMAIGSPKGRFSPNNLIKKIISKLTRTLKGAYAESPAAQNAAGGVLVFITIFITAAVSILFLLVAYKLHVVLGIIIEGLLCWFSISVRDVRIAVTGIYRAIKTERLDLAAKRLKNLSGKETQHLDSDGLISLTLETVSKSACDLAVAPMFFILIFGGAGGIFYKTISLLDDCVGYKNKDFKYFGKPSAKLDDLITFIPARICSKLLQFDAAFLKLNSKNAKRIYNRDKNKTSSPNKGHMQSVCAGALGVSLYSEEYSDGELIQKAPVGESLKPLEPQDIYWSNHLYCGTAAIALILVIILRTSVFFIF